MAAQQAPAGAILMTPMGPATATVVLGNADVKEVFTQRAEQRKGPAETPDAVPRFPQAPGGDSTVCLSNAGVVAPDTKTSITVRAPAGGAAAIVLGGDDPAETFRERQKQREAVIETPNPVSRFQQAPGGTSTIHLSGDDNFVEVASRGPVGGGTSVVLGTVDPRETYDLHQQCREVVIDTPDAAPRFPQAPGGSSSLSLGSQEETMHVTNAVRGPVGGPATIVLADSDGTFDAIHVPRGPVGGVATVVLGNEIAKEVFDQRREERGMVMQTPEAPPRFQQMPGGTASIHLGDGVNLHDSAHCVAAPRGPVGGPATVLFGSDNFKEIVDERKRQSEAEIVTPDAALRFTQGPGGTSSICFNSDSSMESGATSTRGPVGGAVSVVLGGDDSAEVFSQHQKRREAEVETPNAAPRFQQMPGGTASICLGSIAEHANEDACALPAVRGPIGGEATIVLGGDDPMEAFSYHEKNKTMCIETPNGAPRFQQAPGGTATIHLGKELVDGQPQEHHCSKGPVGGKATIMLGGDDAAEAFSSYNQKHNSDIVTPVAALRHQQMPGGNSTIRLGGTHIEDGAAEHNIVNRGPVGGEATIVLGGDDPTEAYMLYSKQHKASIETGEAAPRFQQTPGGNASINFSNEPAADNETCLGMARQCPVGGAATIILGGDDPAEAFKIHQQERAVHVETPEAAPRFKQNPGGTTTLVLGGDFEVNAQPLGAQQRQAPGGISTIVLGGDSNDPFDTFCEQVSSNSYATGTSQNCGNIITERPTTRLHCAPGGNSTIQLGNEEPEMTTKKVSANRFACGANQNCGNTITDRPTTKLHQAPGGTSTICLGGDMDDPFNTHGNKAPVVHECQIGKPKMVLGGA